MVPPGSAGCDTAFSISIDHVGVRQRHRRRRPRPHRPASFLDPAARADHFIRPGHVFPLRAREGGVLERRGHTEAAVDLARLAGLPPVAVICEVLHDDGSPARLPFLELFAQEHRIAIITVDQVATHRAELGHRASDAAAASGRAPCSC